MMKGRSGFVFAVFMLFAVLSAGHSLAQTDYPTRPIHFIVGFAAGGGNDLFARLVVQKFQENTGSTVVIENRVGAGGRIAGEFAARQPADGYTVLVGATGQMSIATAIFPDLSYHASNSFIPLNMIASFPLVLVVPSDHPAKSVKELVAWAKANPDKSNYGTSSPAFTISDGPPAIPLVKGGKTRALAVTGSERSPELPDVPSMTEAGYPEVDTHLWSGFFVPAGTPAPIVAKMTAELGKALADPGVRQGLEKMAVKPGGPTGDAFKKRIDADIKSFAEVVKAANLAFK